MYRCAECGAEAENVSGIVERSCDCTGPIIVEASSTLVGRGGVR